MNNTNILRLTDFKKFILRFVLAAAIFLLFTPNRLPANDCSIDDLRRGFSEPPREAGVRCWWWWLNSNVTKQAITRDLEEMKAKGFSGAMIFDAGTELRWGDAQVPAGPLYGSTEWRQLYKHALKEAKRLGLTLGLSIQSGWNLGGPNVTPDFAAKQVVWSETSIEGPVEYNNQLPTGFTREGFYRDIVVLAYKNKDKVFAGSQFEVSASSSQDEYGPQNAFDGKGDTFWVSKGKKTGQGPTPARPESIKVIFEQQKELAELHIQGRKGYGPKTLQVICVDSDKKTEIFSLEDGISTKLRLPLLKGKTFCLLFEDAYDSRYPETPRNVQVANILLIDSQGKHLTPQKFNPIENLGLKSGTKELGGSAPDCRFLLNDYDSVPGEEDVLSNDVLDITDNMTTDGTLRWSVPEGGWTVLRFGYTITDSHVSTYSGQWKGHVLDYLSRDAFDRYWNEVVTPLLDDAGPLAGTTLKQLETDSWECGGMNWSPGFVAEFRKYRGYDLIRYLPVLAGRIVESRDVSNAFLADFRKTLGDCVADNHYATFAEYAHKYNMQIQPESGGPHAGPLDAIKNLGHSDIVMGEFWVPSPHRPNPVNRFYIKQASSVAHIYGKKIVAAESFTSIGPHWNDVLWQSQKPSMDHEFCSGLNMIFFHTFTCSPKEMGIPGQEYFAGTHINPQVTWWEYSDTFIDYINRCHFITQQGKFVADVLYYYGDHVPNVGRLKEDDPARVLPGYDYDLTDEVILQRLEVSDGRIVVPGGVRYRLLVIPDHKVLSLAALEKVEQLLRQGATILGPKPERLVSLVGGDESRTRFKNMADMLWGKMPDDPGERKIGKGCLIWGKTARQVLAADGVEPDFEVQASEDRVFDYIHYMIGKMDVYFVCNQTELTEDAICRFRVTGKSPQLWDPLTGRIQQTVSFSNSKGRTEIPIRFSPYGSKFVVFTDESSIESPRDIVNYMDYKPVKTIEGPWRVEFDPKWGGPKQVTFDKLMSWTEHSSPGVKFYSGKAVYRSSFVFEEEVSNERQFMLDLGEVGDIGIAQVTLNGRDLGVVWTKPFRVDITEELKSGRNLLEVSVINSWRNRLVGDIGKPQSQRYTKTNITIRKEWKLLDSGLIGPVTIQTSIEEY